MDSTCLCFKSFIILMVFVCGRVGHTCAMPCMWKSEDNQGTTLFFHTVGPRNNL